MTANIGSNSSVFKYLFLPNYKVKFKMWFIGSVKLENILKKNKYMENIAFLTV